MAANLETLKVVKRGGTTLGPMSPARANNGKSCLGFSEASTARPDIHVHSNIWTTYIVNSDEQLTYAAQDQVES